MITNSEIQKRLREAIEQCEKSKVQIAKEIGITPSTISKYLHRDKFPSLETFANLCKILDVSSDDILGLND